MKVIGLTGGIASGKSTISNILQELGAFIIDVDKVARKVVSPGESAYNKIVENFGREVLLSDGQLNRKQLGAIVFSDKQKLDLLNQITHPEMIKDTKTQIETLKKQTAKAAVIDAAILIEMGLHKLCDSVWVIHIDTETQIKRIMERDKLGQDEALKRIQSQLQSEEREKYADIIIDNTKPIEDVRREVATLWENIKNYINPDKDFTSL